MHPFLRGRPNGKGGKFWRKPGSYPLVGRVALPRVKRKKKPATEQRGGGGNRGGIEGKDRELSPTMRSLPTWWIEVSFENVCAHGQIHKEGCKPRLRPSSGGSLIFRTKFHPIPDRRRYSLAPRYP